MAYWLEGRYSVISIQDLERYKPRHIDYLVTLPIQLLDTTSRVILSMYYTLLNNSFIYPV